MENAGVGLVPSWHRAGCTGCRGRAVAQVGADGMSVAIADSYDGVVGYAQEAQLDRKA